MTPMNLAAAGSAPSKPASVSAIAARQPRPQPAAPQHVPTRRPQIARASRARRRFAKAGIALAAATALLVPAMARAEPRLAVPPALQRSAALCLGEALRLCPAALSSRDHGLSCILGKRHLLTAPCRTVYDQGLRLLQGRDLHLTLRRPGAR